MPTKPTHPINPTRFDPYKNFKFRLKFDGRIVAGVSKASGLKRSSDTAPKTGRDPSRLPGRSKYDPITLERGVTHDASFGQWANQVQGIGGVSEISLANLRRELVLELYDEAGHKVRSYAIHGAWVSEYQALPDLDANAGAVAIEHMKIENEGWDEDPPAAG